MQMYGAHGLLQFVASDRIPVPVVDEEVIAEERWVVKVGELLSGKQQINILLVGIHVAEASDIVGIVSWRQKSAYSGRCQAWSKMYGSVDFLYVVMVKAED